MGIFKLACLAVVSLLATAAASCKADSKVAETVDTEENRADTVDGGISSGSGTVPKTTAPKSSRVEVVSAGLSSGQSFGRPEVSAAAIVRNTGAVGQEDVQVVISIKDANGVILKTETERLAYIPANAEAYAAPSFYLDEGSPPAASVDAQVIQGENADESAPIGFTFSNLRYASSEYSARISGTITSSLAKSVTNVKVQCVGLNNGAPVGGGFTFVDAVPAGQSVGFEVGNGPIKNMKVTEVRCAGVPSNLSDIR